MHTNITSENQKGGITAQNVVIGAGVVGEKTASKKNANSNRLVRRGVIVVGGVVGFLASVVAILQYFGITPW